MQACIVCGCDFFVGHLIRAPIISGAEKFENPLLYLCLFGVREFRTIRPEYFDAVILIWIVRGGNDHAPSISEPFRQKRHGGCRNHAGILKCCRSPREAFLEMVENPRTRHARVLANEYLSTKFFADGA